MTEETKDQAPSEETIKIVTQEVTPPVDAKFSTTMEDAPPPPPEDTPKVVVLSRKKKAEIKLATVPAVNIAAEPELDPDADYAPNSTANTTAAEMRAGRAALAKHQAELERNRGNS